MKREKNPFSYESLTNSAQNKKKDILNRHEKNPCSSALYDIEYRFNII